MMLGDEAELEGEANFLFDFVCSDVCPSVTSETREQELQYDIQNILPGVFLWLCFHVIFTQNIVKYT